MIDTIDESLSRDLERLSIALVPDIPSTDLSADHLPPSSPIALSAQSTSAAPSDPTFTLRQPSMRPRTRRVLVAAAAVLLVWAATAGLILLRQSTPEDPLVEPTIESKPPIEVVPSPFDHGADLIVWISPDATRTDVIAIGDAIKAFDDIVDVERLQYWDYAASMVEARRLLADDPDTLTLLNEANLPTQYNVIARAGQTTHLRSVADQLSTVPNVQRVQIASDWVPGEGQPADELTPETTTPPATPGRPTYGILRDYLYVPANLEQLVQLAPIVIRGTVSAISQTVEHPDAVTATDIVITEVLGGDPKLVGTTVFTRLPGADTPEARYVEADQELFVVGDDVVAFLQMPLPDPAPGAPNFAVDIVVRVTDDVVDLSGRMSGAEGREGFLDGVSVDDLAREIEALQNG